ncbi:MAG: ATP synthase F1 subunit epsilon [Fidelibacterota bacterium]
MKTFHLDIVTPTRELDLGEVTYLRAPGLDGLFGILADHTNALFAVDVGEVKVERNSEKTYFATSGGYLEVTGSQAQLLVETVERADEIDVDRARSARDRARERLSARREDLDRERALASLKRSGNRLRIAERTRSV